MKKRRHLIRKEKHKISKNQAQHIKLQERVSKVVKTQTSIAFINPQVGEFFKIKERINQKKKQEDIIRKMLPEIIQQYNIKNKTKFNQIKKFRSIQQKLKPISIDELFSFQAASLWEQGYHYNDVSTYLRILNNQLYKGNTSIIIQNDNQFFFLNSQSDELNEKWHAKGRFLNFLQKQTLINREKFIQKLQINQQKYNNTNSKISQISQQLLFLLKIYLSNTVKLKQELTTIYNQIQKPQAFVNKDSQLVYYQVVMKKNIKYAMNESLIQDELNYFKQAQHEQRNSHDVYVPIHDIDSFHNYLKNKKPKIGRLAKFGLHTACACCFSDFYQQYNPFIACQGCHLRCHRLCLDLKARTCGNCSYQRLLKITKNKVPFCFICQQKGQMTFKIEDSRYAHYFCLLFHGLWKVKKNLIMQQNATLIQQASMQRQINPQIQIADKEYCQYNIYFQCQNDLQQCSLMQASESLNIQECASLQKANQMKSFSSKKSVCNICFTYIHSNLYVKCQSCHTKYHAFCSYFEGFSFKLQRQRNSSNKQKNLQFLISCCPKATIHIIKLKRKREFILNRNKFLFNKI